MPPSFNMSNILLLPLKELKHIHLIIKKLFSKNVIPDVPLAGRTKTFPRKLENVNKRQGILSFVASFQILLLQVPRQEKVPTITYMNSEKKKQLQLEVENILRKRAISVCNHREGKFRSNLFLIKMGVMAKA